MFICQSCGKNSEPHVSPVKVITETRERKYTNTIKKGKKTFKTTTYGSEIVSEVSCCGKCAKKLSAEQ